MLLSGRTNYHAAIGGFAGSRVSVRHPRKCSSERACYRREAWHLGLLRVQATSSQGPGGPQQLQPPPAPPAVPSAAPAQPSVPQSFSAVGTASILFVSIMWGTYTPALRFAYGLPGAPDPFVLNSVRGVLQCSALLAAALLLPSATSYLPAASAKEEEEVEMMLMAGGAVEASAPHVAEPLAAAELAGGDPASSKGGDPGAGQQTQQAQQLGQQQRQLSREGEGEGVVAQLQRVVDSMNPAILGGFEIGFYNTMGTTAQSFALAYTTATRGAFLIQATSIFTPLLLAASGASPRRQVWLGSLLALAGAVLVALEGSDGGGGGGGAAAATSEQMIVGDALTIFAALCYSMATLRIGRYATRVPPLDLALGKSVTLATVSLALLGGTLFFGGGLGSLAQLWPSYRDPMAWGVIAYSAVGPGALAAYFHVKGQSLIPPAEAQILFATVPLWSVLFASLLLQGEGGGLVTWLGGGCMVAAGVVAAL